jgi:hypothetical protein
MMINLARCLDNRSRGAVHRRPIQVEPKPNSEAYPAIWRGSGGCGWSLASSLEERSDSWLPGSCVALGLIWAITRRRRRRPNLRHHAQEYDLLTRIKPARGWPAMRIRPFAAGATKFKSQLVLSFWERWLMSIGSSI